MGANISGCEILQADCRDLSELSPGTHACVLYDSPGQLCAVLPPFVRGGLDRNERVIVFASPEDAAIIRNAVHAAGVDVDGSGEAAGALRFVDERTHLTNDRFDPDIMMVMLARTTDGALADGYNGVRLAGDVAWELGPTPDFDLLPQYEAHLDGFIPGRPITGLCLYRNGDFPPTALQTALRSHSVVTLGERLIPDNPYHEPPEWTAEVVAAPTEADRYAWMAATLRERAEAEERNTLAMREEVREALSAEVRDRLVRVLEGMSDAFLALDTAWRVTYANPEALRISGPLAPSLVGSTIWDLDPDGADSVAARAFRRAVAERRAVRLEHRIERAGVVRWLDISAYPSPDGLNVFYRDITERKAAEDRQRLLMREVDHRAKNALAVAQSIVMLTRAETMPAFVAAVEGRIAALARVHTLLARDRWSGADLAEIVTAELEPYRAGSAAGLRIAGGPVRVVADAAQPLAMVLHELATNAAKYGALSVPGGEVAVVWRSAPGGGVRVEWTERGGPPVREPQCRGFGSQLIDSAVVGQLDGAVELHWKPDGLACAFTLAADRLVAVASATAETLDGAAPLPRAAADALLGRRVLLVEDDALLAMGMRLSLEALGCDVVGPASVLEEALRLAAAEELDLAVLDVNLRGRESWVVADILSARGVPYLFTTGYGDVGAQAMPRGATVLTKPFHPDRLAAALNRLATGEALPG